MTCIIDKVLALTLWFWIHTEKTRVFHDHWNCWLVWFAIVTDVGSLSRISPVGLACSASQPAWKGSGWWIHCFAGFFIIGLRGSIFRNLFPILSLPTSWEGFGRGLHWVYWQGEGIFVIWVIVTPWACWWFDFFRWGRATRCGFYFCWGGIFTNFLIFPVNRTPF